MSNNAALEALLKERDKLISKRDVEYHRASMEISGIEAAIESLSGKKFGKLKRHLSMMMKIRII